MQSSFPIANRLMREGRHADALVAYQQLVQAGHPMKDHIARNIALCELQIHASATPQVISPSVPQAVTHEQSDVVVCMTTIQSRLPQLRKVLETLHQQDHPPSAIRLHISRDPYLLDTGVPNNDPDLLALMDLPLLQIRWVPNTGPYRKIVPFLEEHFANHLTRDRLFVTVDDDTLYPEYFLSTLLAEFRKHDCVIAFRGRELKLEAARIASYATWGLGLDRADLANVPTGKDGVLYSTRFFTRDFVNLKDALETAPTADDLWIKWHCALNGVPSLILRPDACTSDYKSFPVVDYSKEYRGNSLYTNFNSNASHGRNDASVGKLESHFERAYGYGLGDLITSGRTSA